VNDFVFGTLGIESFYVCNVVANAASRRVKRKDWRRICRLYRAAAPQWPIEIGKMENDPRTLAGSK
jgi:hypothetical protein